MSPTDRLAGAVQLDLEVVAAVDLTPRMRRITLTSDALADVEHQAGQDLSLNVPSDSGRVRRRYTIRHLDRHARTVDLDFVLHGHGPAALWAAAARPGDRIGAMGPRGKITLRHDVDWHLFVGDESAVPVTLTMLEALPLGATAIVLLEVADGDDEHLPPVPVQWLARGDAVPGGPEVLANAVDALALPAGRGAAYLNGEKAVVRLLQGQLMARGLAADDIARKAYWNRLEANGDHGEPIPDGMTREQLASRLSAAG